MENIVLIIILIICVITDIKSRRILNIITLPTILLGFTYYFFFYGLDGFLFSGKGFLVGLVVLFLPFFMGGIGAGDVKLMAAIGALKGASFVFYAFLYTAIVGGFIALLILLRRKGIGGFFIRIYNSIIMLLFKQTPESIQLNKKDLAPSFPYGVAIAIGTVTMIFMEGKL